MREGFEANKHFGWVLAFIAVCLQVLGSFLNRIVLLHFGYNKPILVTFLSAVPLSLLVSLDKSNTLISFKSTAKQDILISLPAAVFYMIANLPFVISVTYTTVSSSLCISQSATLIAFALSLIFLKESISVEKIIALIMSVGGVLMVVMGDKSHTGSGSNAILGDSLALLSAIGTSVYLVYAKYVLVKSNMSPTKLLGLVGMWFAVAAVPVMALMDLARIESLNVPSSAVCGWISLLALSGVGFNIFLNLALERSSPLFVRISIASSLPLSYAVDLIARLATFHWLKAIGSLMVLLSLLMFAFVQRDKADQKDCEKHLLQRQESEQEYEIICESESLL